MPSGPVAESKSRVERTFQVQMTQSPGTIGDDREEWVPIVRGWGQYLEANAELRHSTFSRAESAVVPFEEMEGEHTPEMTQSGATRFCSREASLKVHS